MKSKKEKRKRKESVGDFPVNSRIKIVHRGNIKNPKISFTYPNKAVQLGRIRHSGIINFINFIVLTFIFFTLVLVEVSTFIKISIVLIVYYGFPILLSHLVINTKIGKSSYPKAMAFLRNKNFYTKITECSKNKIIEIPLFENVYMDYYAKGDFYKYLGEVIIKEHDFKMWEGRRWKKNVHLWKAIFKFDKQPKEGFLEIKWT
jgi:hypothetical protein